MNNNDSLLKELKELLQLVDRNQIVADGISTLVREASLFSQERLRPHLPELRDLKNEAMIAASEMDTNKLLHISLRLRGLVARIQAEPIEAEADTETAPVAQKVEETIAALQALPGLRADGVLSEEEYNAKKSELLQRL